MSLSPVRVPHQIPFRAASAARRIDERTIEGIFLVSANDALAEGSSPSLMLLEAMAQMAGSLIFDDPAVPGFLTAVDDAEFPDSLVAGDRVEVLVRLDAEFGGMHRFSGTLSMSGFVIGKARFYLAGGSRASDTP